MASCSLPMDNAVRYIAGGNAYCTHPVPPYADNNRSIYRSKTTPFTPKTSQKQAARWNSVRSTNRIAKHNYWQDKNDKYSLSFDDIAVYLDGEMIVSSVPHLAGPPQQTNNNSWLICACLPKEPLSEEDYNTYKAIDNSLTPDLIGCQRVVCLFWNQAILKNQLIILCNVPAEVGYTTVRAYIRDIDAGYELWWYPSFAGFKTDCLNLIINTQEQEYYDPNMGLYRLEFSADYTSHSSIKIADSNYNQVNEVQTYTNTTNDVGADGVITATWTESSINGGFVVVDVFQSKDDFTAIVLNVSAWNYDFSYSKIVDSDGNWTRTSTQNRLEEWKYSAYKLVNDNLVHHRDLYTDRIEEAGIANDSYVYSRQALTINQTLTTTEFAIDSKVLFANWKTDTYLWVKQFQNSVFTVTGSREPYWSPVQNKYVYDPFDGVITGSSNYYKLQYLKNNELTTLDERLYSSNGNYPTLISQLPVKEWNFANRNINKENDYTYYGYFNSVYDGKYLMLGCYNLDWRRINSPYPKSIKMNIKTGDYVILDNRLDVDGYYPLSVTLDKTQ